MTVRTTPTESGTTPRPPDLHPPVPGDAPPEVAGVGQSPTSPPNGTDPPSGPAGAGGTDRPWPSPDRPRTDSRRALRDARRQRRRASVVCAVVVAVCLALTILVVDLARNRAAGPQGVGPALALLPVTHPRFVPLDPQPPETHGAAAPEGADP